MTSWLLYEFFLEGLVSVPYFFISAISITNTAHMANDNKQNVPLLFWVMFRLCMYLWVPVHPVT